MKIQFRFLIILSVIAVSSVFVTGFTISYLVENILEERILNQLDATASIQKSRINEAVEKNFERLNGVTSRTQLRESLNNYLENGEDEADLINKILNDAKNSISDFISVTIVTPSGMAAFSTDENQINQNYSDSKFFSEAFSDNYISCSDDGIFDKSFIVSGPLILDGKFLGVLMIHVDSKIISHIVNDYTNLGKTGETVLAMRNENGDAVFILDTRLGAENFGPIPKSNINLPITIALLKDETQLLDRTDHRGEPILASTRYIEKSDWGLVVKMDKSEAFESLVTMQQYVVLISAIVASFSIVISLYFSNTLSTPIMKLKSATESLSKGNFESKITLSTGDELEELANSFNHMADSIKKSMSLEEQSVIQSNLKRALDESADVAITNQDGVITHVNDNFCNSSKYSRKELLGENHRILKSGHHSPEFYKNMWDTITSGKVWHDEIKNKAKDGTFYWNEMSIVPFFDKYNKIYEYVAIRRDITERKKLQDEKIINEKMISIGQLSSRLAHDIRNPLSIIQISFENLKAQYGLDKSKQKQFEKVQRSIDRIVHQMDDVLGFVKGHVPEFDKVKASEIIHECMDSLVIPDNIKIILPKKDSEFLADKKLFSIAINNLILNGIQAITGTGTIEIIVEEDNYVVTIQIKDSGVGIPNEHLDKIFDPLFTTKQVGTGLGLSSVKSIVNAHGGIISVTSPPTIFTIALPSYHVFTKD